MNANTLLLDKDAHVAYIIFGYRWGESYRCPNQKTHFLIWPSTWVGIIVKNPSVGWHERRRKPDESQRGKK
jgi:hypothetical protein